MPIGPGKYGANAEQLLRQVGGSLCVIILIGDDGPSFDIATTNMAQLAVLPTILRATAEKVEADLQLKKH